MIVSKFYSRLEKLGLKKHKVIQDEVEYLSTLPQMEQFELFSNESDFIIERLRIKMNIFLSFSILFILLTFYLIVSQIYIPIIATSLCFLIFLVFTKRYKTKMEIKSLGKYILKDIQKRVIDKSFR